VWQANVPSGDVLLVETSEVRLCRHIGGYLPVFHGQSPGMFNDFLVIVAQPTDSRDGCRFAARVCIFQVASSCYFSVQAKCMHCSSKWKYICAIVAFAVLAVYMTVAAVFCAYRAIQGFSSNIVFAELVISILTTYGCWVSWYNVNRLGEARGLIAICVQVIASLLALDPWHLGVSELKSCT
jgi:hypothetical protein